jgi:hypothetical protein
MSRLVHALNSAILLRKLPRQRLNALHHPLEIILLFTSQLALRRRVVFLVTPLDLDRREVQLGVEAENILVVVRGEAAERGDEGHELADVVPG